MIVVSVCLPSDAHSAPMVLLGFLLPWMWGISSRLLQQSAANHAKLSRMKELGEKMGVLVGLDLPSEGGGTEAGV